MYAIESIETLLVLAFCNRVDEEKKAPLVRGMAHYTE